MNTSEKHTRRRRRLSAGMGAKNMILVAAVAVAAAFLLVQPQPASAETVCFNLVGGTGCAEAGTPEAEALAAQQAAYYASVGLPDPGPWTPATTTSTTEAPAVPDECFILVGGTFCFPAGSPEAVQAAIDEAAYIASVTTTTVPPTAAPSPSAPAAQEQPVEVTVEITGPTTSVAPPNTIAVGIAAPTARVAATLPETR